MSGGEGEILQHPKPKKKQPYRALQLWPISVFPLLYFSKHPISVLCFFRLFLHLLGSQSWFPASFYILRSTFCTVGYYKFPSRLSVYRKKTNKRDPYVTDADISLTFPEYTLLGRKLFIYSFRNPHSHFFSVLLFVLVFNVLEVYDHVQHTTPNLSRTWKHEKKILGSTFRNSSQYF